MIVYHLDLWQVLGFVAQFILPLLVGLVTTRVTPGARQALLLAALTAVVSVVTTALTAHDAGQPFDLVSAILTALAGFLVSTGAHFGIWKPTGVAGALLRIGSPPPPAPPLSPLPAAAEAEPLVVLAPVDPVQTLPPTVAVLNPRAAPPDEPPAA